MPRFIQVRSPAGPMRRAGRAFGTELVILETDELAEGELDALTNEPRLEVDGSDDGEEFIRLEPTEAAVELASHDASATEAPADLQAEVEGLRREASDLVAAVSGVLSRFAPDMDVVPDLDEAPLATMARLLEQLVGHETPCDREIAALKSQVSALTSEREALKGNVVAADEDKTKLTGERDEAVNAHARVVEQLATAQAKIVELGGPPPGDPPIEAAPKETKPKAKTKS